MQSGLELQIQKQGRHDMSYYKTINGVKMDKELVSRMKRLLVEEMAEFPRQTPASLKR